MRFDRTGSGEDLQSLLLAETDYASTPEGQAEAARKAEAGEAGPGDLPSAYWQRIADNGLMLRERNVMIAQGAAEAQRNGDAFHAATQEQMGECRLPPSVRGSKGLSRFLDQKAEDMPSRTLSVRDSTSEITSLDVMLARVGAADPDSDATYVSGVPRSAGEKLAWIAHLNERRNAAGESYVNGCDVVAETMAVLDRFGRPTGGYTQSLATPQSGNDVGFVGRIRAEDGSLSEDAYVVHQWNRDGTVGVWPVRPVTPNPTPDPNGRVDAAGVWVVNPTDDDHQFQVAPADLERADEGTWNRFVGTAIPTSFAGDKVIMRTAGQRQERDFNDFRYRHAVEAHLPAFPDLHPGQSYLPKAEPKYGLRGRFTR